ncbi:flavodoxin [Clostridium magnum]|uniref:Flavodoxin n=1 Tax=Clostridium magnum DSM 2767 TaxID=1121326 RepID=A0A162RYY3_9CLOT|nr:flavodoxin [Clostridium magnum]KZL90567.1 flavodoxin [Clostridium magnum DSM 2767]SHI05232.1 flavodoxin, short chain [Clostridium magnum DSM 2767]
MKNIVIIYWSGTGNTEAMANGIAEGVKLENVHIKSLNVGDASVEDIINADVVALGCPSMGAEELEESEMEPFVDSISQAINNKNVALFGSYGWGDGEWMRNWEDRMKNCGAKLVQNGLIINNEPDDEGLELCRKLGEKLSKA